MHQLHSIIIGTLPAMPLCPYWQEGSNCNWWLHHLQCKIQNSSHCKLACFKNYSTRARMWELSSSTSTPMFHQKHWYWIDHHLWQIKANNRLLVEQFSWHNCLLSKGLVFGIPAWSGEKKWIPLSGMRIYKEDFETYIGLEKNMRINKDDKDAI